MKTFELGDEVAWSGHTVSHMSKKGGTVVEIVEPGESWPRGEWEKTHHIMYEGPMQRDHVSYLVEIRGTGNGRHFLFWPSARSLRKVKPKTNEGCSEEPCRQTGRRNLVSDFHRDRSSK
jgi:hypothetical protein